jgi:hypothetical protein
MPVRRSFTVHRSKFRPIGHQVAVQQTRPSAACADNGGPVLTGDAAIGRRRYRNPSAARSREPGSALWKLDEPARAYRDMDELLKERTSQ